MDGVAGSSLLPLHHCKTLHLVRHARGIYNVEGEHNYQAYLSPALFDARLTPLGWAQVDNLRKHVHECGLAKRIDLVITSPLQRVAKVLRVWCTLRPNNHTQEAYLSVSCST